MSRNKSKDKPRHSYDGYSLTKQGVRNLAMGQVVPAAAPTVACVNP